MEHIESVRVNIDPERGLSYPLREPVVCSQPKTPHYCLHQSCFGIPCQTVAHSNTPPPIPFSNTYLPVQGSSSEASNLHCHPAAQHHHHHMSDVACTCGNMCSRNSYPIHSEAIIHQRRPEYTMSAGCDCQHPAHRPSMQHSTHHIQPHYHYPTSSRVAPFEEVAQHTTTSIHLATNNLTYPTPHYAMAFASSNQVRSTSWEPIYHREFSSHLGPAVRRSNNSHEIDGARHIHHHHHHVAGVSSRTYSEPYVPFRHAHMHQQSYSLPHHVRRYSSRLLSYPYPSVINYTSHHTPQYIFSTPILLPRRHFIQTGLDFFGGIDVEEGEWEEHMHGVEPPAKGLSKDSIEKLPHYLVTKSTMEEFTDRERCVICICDFDVGETLRILPCAHEFHMGCVDKWLETNATCPICRTNVEVS